MDAWIPGSLFTVFFLWGLWEWSQRIKRRKAKDNDTPKTEKNLDKVKLQRALAERETRKHTVGLCPYCNSTSVCSAFLKGL